jgi:hypothetical protein
VSLVHLPALNTPQHSWSKSRMPRKAQPVPPIFEPELAAAAIYHAAFHYRREWTLGMITDLVLAGNKVAPGLGDWYMAQTGYESQMTSEPDDPQRPHNLWEPLPGDAGAHGRFSDRAQDHSWQWWLTKNRTAVWTMAGACAALGLWAWHGRE